MVPPQIASQISKLASPLLDPFVGHQGCVLSFIQTIRISTFCQSNCSVPPLKYITFASRSSHLLDLTTHQVTQDARKFQISWLGTTASELEDPVPSRKALLALTTTASSALGELILPESRAQVADTRKHISTTMEPNMTYPPASPCLSRSSSTSSLSSPPQLGGNSCNSASTPTPHTWGPTEAVYFCCHCGLGPQLYSLHPFCCNCSIRVCGQCRFERVRGS